MSEESEEEGTEEVSEQAPPSKDVKTKASELIKASNEASERLEAANKRREELIEEEAKLKLERTFEGKADAGKGNKEETPEEYAKKVMSGEK